MMIKMLKTKMNMGLQGHFSKQSPIIIDDNTKIQLMKMQRTPKSNIDEKLLNNTIGENIHGTKGITSGIEVSKLVKISFHSDIENLNK